MHRILPHNAPRFAANCTAFCRKLHRILPQNATRFAAKCSIALPQIVALFCRKTIPSYL